MLLQRDPDIPCLSVTDRVMDGFLRDAIRFSAWSGSLTSMVRVPDAWHLTWKSTTAWAIRYRFSDCAAFRGRGLTASLKRHVDSNTVETESDRARHADRARSTASPIRSYREAPSRPGVDARFPGEGRRWREPGHSSAPGRSFRVPHAIFAALPSSDRHGRYRAWPRRTR